MERFTKALSSVGNRLRDKGLGKVHKAAAVGDLAKLKELVAKKECDINQLDKRLGSALHIACAAGYVETVQFLVESEAMLNQYDKQYRSPLMKAVQGQHESCVSILLENHADPYLMDIDGNTALHLTAKSASVYMAWLLLQHDADINVPNMDGLTPLGVAVHDNHFEMAEFLLQEGADVNTIDADKRSLLMMAAENGQVKMLQLLLQNEADDTLQDNKGLTAKDYAQKEKHNPCSFIFNECTTQSVRASSTCQEQGKEKKKLSSASLCTEVELLGGPVIDMGEYREEFADNSEAESLSGADGFSSSDGKDESPTIKKKFKLLNPREMFSSETRGASALPDTSLSTAGSKPKHGTAASQSIPKDLPSSKAPLLSPIPETKTLHDKMANYSFDFDFVSDSNNKEESVSSEPSDWITDNKEESVSSEPSDWITDNKEESVSSESSDLTKDNEEEPVSCEFSDWDSHDEEEAVAREFAKAKRAVNKQNEPISQDQNGAMPKEVESEKPEVAAVAMVEDCDDSNPSKPAEKKHNQLELQTEVAQLTLQLQREQENCLKVTMMFDAIKDDLERTKDQLHCEIQERQMVEFTLRKVEQERVTLDSNMKRLEQDHIDKERALSLSESHLLEVNKTLKEQLEDVRKETKANSKREISKLRSDCEERVTVAEERVTLAEERHKELASQAADLRDQVSKLKGTLEERDTSLRQLQEDLADSPKRLSTDEISQEADDSDDSEKLHTLKAVGRLKEKLADREDRCVRAENRIKQLEEAVQMMEIKNCKLSEAAKQADKIEALQKAAHDARLEQEINRNAELQKKNNKLCAWVKTAKKKLLDQNMGGECNSTTKSFKVELERETSRCRELEKDNSDLREELSLNKERFRAELQHKLDQVNLFLKDHVANQEQKIRELETKEQHILSQRDLIQSELKMYKSMYSEQLRVCKCRSAQARSHFLTDRNTSLYGGSLMSSSPDGGTLGSSPVKSYRLDDYCRKMQSELDRSSSRFSPVGPVYGAPMSRTTLQYQDMLNRNNCI